MSYEVHWGVKLKLFTRSRAWTYFWLHTGLGRVTPFDFPIWGEWNFENVPNHNFRYFEFTSI